MKVFFDTNVLLDMLAHREGEACARQIVKYLQGPYNRICVSYLALADAAYILRKTYSSQQIRCILADINAHMKVLPGVDQHFYDLQKINGDDLEDCLQILSAEYEKCDVIITRNAKDFKKNTIIPVLTPEEFLQHTSK